MILLTSEYAAYKTKMEAQKKELMYAVRCQQKDIEELHLLLDKEPWVAELKGSLSTRNQEEIERYFYGEPETERKDA